MNKFTATGAALLAFCLAGVPNRATSDAPRGRTLTVARFGAVGDSTTDDTKALQKALDGLRAGDTLTFPAGKTYRHSDVLTVHVAGVHLTGTGTLLATNEERSCFHIDADAVTVEGLTFKILKTSRRFDAYEQMKVRLSGHRGTVLRRVTVDGSAAAGVYIGGASQYRLEDVTVKNTRADGIHNTDGAHDGVIVRPVIRNVGDDGVAVVSYANKGAVPCRNITVESPRFYGNVWGRGFSVVGGEDITFRNVYAENSNGAAIYLASEGEPWFTFGCKRVRILGGELHGSNLSKTVDHGAILIYNGRTDYSNDDIQITGLKIIDTRATASRQVGILGSASGVLLRDFQFVNGPANLLTTNVAPERYTTVGWTYLARPADHIGFALPPAGK